MSIRDADQAYAHVLELLHTRSLEGWGHSGFHQRSSLLVPFRSDSSQNRASCHCAQSISAADRLKSIPASDSPL